MKILILSIMMVIALLLASCAGSSSSVTTLQNPVDGECEIILLPTLESLAEEYEYITAVPICNGYYVFIESGWCTPKGKHSTYFYTRTLIKLVTDAVKRDSTLVVTSVKSTYSSRGTLTAAELTIECCVE